MRSLLLAILFAVPSLAAAQITLLDAHSTASLRGIDAVSDQVAWASGSAGTILLTTDGGQNWKHCVTPKGAEKLDFRGVQAFNAQTAVIMASGPGALSAVYKTTDACASWKLVFANPDTTPGKEGFFDALRRVTDRQMYLMGDPVDGKFAMFFSPDRGEQWFIADDPGLTAAAGAGGFAASNTSFAAVGITLLFGTSASKDGAAQVYATRQRCASGVDLSQVQTKAQTCSIEWVPTAVPLASTGASAGVYSIAGRTSASMSGKLTQTIVAVGGDYTRPNESQGTAAVSRDGGITWLAAAQPPAGYRSAVAYLPAVAVWIAAGPNGIDLSRDDGLHWTPFKPAAADPAGIDKGWNALSMPFLVGARGRVGRVAPSALAP